MGATENAGFKAKLKYNEQRESIHGSIAIGYGYG